MNKIKKRFIIFGIIAGLVATAVLVVLLGFRTKTIICEGNERLSDESVTEYIFANKYPNSLIYKIFGKKNKHIPFASGYDAEIAAPDTLRIIVHEREFIAYYEKEGINMYIDTNGVVTDISEKLIEGVPKIEGIEFADVSEGKKAKTLDENALKGVLSYANAFKLNEIPSDKISFDENGDVSIAIGDVTVLCGGSVYVNEKMERLSKIVNEFDGLKGILHMETFDGSEKNLYFKKIE